MYSGDNLGRIGGGRAEPASLADAILSAPFEAGGWDRALKRLATETRSGRSQLVAFGGPSTIPLNWVTDPEPGFIEEFPLINGGSPEVNWRVACTAAPLELAWEHHYAEASRRLRSDIYDEFVNRFRLPHGCQTVLLNTPDVFYGLAVLRSGKDGTTTEADRKVFAAAAPHVVTAVKLQQAMEHQGATLLAGGFEALGRAIFVCDRRGQVQALTSAAEALLREPIGLRMVRGKLIADRADDNRALQNALRRVLADTTQMPGSVQFWLHVGPTTAYGHRCEILPLPRKDWSLGFEPRALVCLHSPDGIDSARLQPLRALLGLTQAEAEVALLAADGSSREEIALARGATVSTVSSQFKSIFQKAGVTREAQLVALLGRLLR